MKRLLVLLALVPCLALAAGWGLTRSYGTFSTEALCRAAAASQPAGTYLCSNVTQTTVTITASTPGEWQKLADEGASFSIVGTKWVRYGVDPTYVQKSMTGVGTCNNTFFGTDPAIGTLKHCDVWTGSSAPPVATIRGATLSWAAPTTNADGTPLTDLAGYRVAWGPVPGVPSDSISLPASALTYTFASIPAERTYFTVRALDLSGNESAPSVEVSK